jgi:4-amino-4-deoxy-L-arabinose transferase-like glycosyltransferase
MVIMFIGSFIIQYYLMSPIMVSNRIDITNNIGKAYIATIMGLFMVLLEVMMHDHQYHVFSTNFYIILAALLALFVYLYRKQVAINDTQYLEGMIEHHSMALLTSEQILNKTDNYDVAKLAKNIIQQQEDEIREMRELLKKPNI